VYRERIKVLDCVIRDVGFIDNHYMTDDFDGAVCRALSKSSGDYMEFGYRSSRELFPPEDCRARNYCDDDKIRQVVDGVESDVRISFMVGSYHAKEQHFAPADESPIDTFRALYCEQIEYMVKLYKEHPPGKTICIHCHNNQRLAYADSI